MEASVRHGNVATALVDVLVNASNTQGNLGSGVSAAIRRACGEQFQTDIHEALRARFGNAMEPGDVLVTGAGTHPHARFVAHVAVMDYREQSAHAAKPDADRIRRGCTNLWAELERIDRDNLSVGMVALGAGTGSMGVRQSVDIACTTLRAHASSHRDSNIGSVVFHGYELHEYANVVSVVRKHFSIDLSNEPADLIAFVDTLDSDCGS
ncbi:MAG: macro domain-containing protein [Sandaracinaceae bacterium]|jgi:O-acetyl-ADP-ribose deacetylase (regulator of RNase III)|nr:macro domain-containing protein [Sandaracinaceae bacterium]